MAVRAGPPPQPCLGCGPGPNTSREALETGSPQTPPVPSDRHADTPSAHDIAFKEGSEQRLVLWEPEPAPQIYLNVKGKGVLPQHMVIKARHL